jgi:ribosomal protein L11 methylase PrmA
MAVQYDLIADEYDTGITSDLSEAKLSFELIDLTGISDPQGWRILDLGCGSGVL